jgi:hypothetical protein
MPKAAKAAKAKSIRAYLITVSGQGDTFQTLVDKKTWDWMDDPIKIPMTPDMLERVREYMEDEEWTPQFNPSIGSLTNDAALAAPGIRVDGKIAAFTSVKDCLKFIQKYNIKIIDTWEGYIY